MTRLNVALLAWAVSVTFAATALFFDNRFLAGMIRHNDDGEWVRQETFARLVEACEAFGQVTKRDQDLLQRTKRMLEADDDIRERKFFGEEGNDQVRGFSGRADQRSAGR